MNKRLTVLSIGAILVVIVLLIPVHQRRIVSLGTDSFTSHYPLFGARTLQHQMKTQDTTIGFGTILVDLYKKRALSDVGVDIVDTSTGAQLVSGAILASAIQDDSFATIEFPEASIAKNTDITITLAAPNATNQNPIGVRLDNETKDISLSVIEYVPAYKALSTLVVNREREWTTVLPAIGIALGIAIAIWAPGKRLKWILAIACIALLTFSTRIWTIQQFGGVSGGDAYNYLSITQSILRLENPFENTKRLPGYPLLLTPFVAAGTFNEQTAMRVMSTVASIGILGATVALARTLSLSWPTAIASVAILAFQKDFFWTSMRPEPYSIYSALLILSLTLFLQSYKKSSLYIQILFGFVLGYAAMTRQEGFMAAVVLGTCSLSYEVFAAYTSKNIRASVLRVVRMYVPALCMVLPFFIHNFWAYGNPLYTPYLEGDRLQIVDSFLAFQDASGATWGIISSMWKPAWDQLERIPVASPLFIISFFGLWAWYWALGKLNTFRYFTILTALGIGLTAGMAILAIYMKPVFTAIVPTMTAAWVLASIPLFIHKTSWRGIAIFAVLVSQVGIATWFHPFAKHYQQSLPIIVLMLTAALTSNFPKNKLATGALTATIVLPFLITGAFLGQKINAAIDEQNEETALDSVAYRAARFARTLPTPIGFDQAYLPARLYFDEVARYFPAEDNPTPEMEQVWLADNPIQTLVVTNANNVFKTPDPSWKLLKEFKAAGNDEKILIGSVYAIPF